eukprot:15457799-Alexandrium_andersonii.AAC.2
MLPHEVVAAVWDCDKDAFAHQFLGGDTSGQGMDTFWRRISGSEWMQNLPNRDEIASHPRIVASTRKH